MRFATRVAVMALFSFATLHAGDKAPAALRCRAFAVGSAPVESLYVKSGGTYVPVTVSTDFITPSFGVDAKEGVVFYRKVADVAKTGGESAKVRFEPFASCAPESGSTRQLVFLSRDTPRWVAFAKADDEGSFPKGCRLVINLSPRAVAFDFGGTTLRVEARKSGLLRAARNVAEGGVAPVRMARATAKGDWVTFFSGVWRQTDDERHILLISPAPGSEEVSVSSVMDVPEPAETSGKKAAPGR